MTGFVLKLMDFQGKKLSVVFESLATANTTAWTPLQQDPPAGRQDLGGAPW